MPGLPSSVDLDECIARLYKKELLAESVIEAICAKTKELLMRESNVVHVAAPITVVGDIHGQFFDLIEIFRIGGYCPDTNYLFLGLSPSIHSIDQIKIIDRFREIPHEGPMADLVWSDPDPERDEFSLSPRGAGYTFGAQVVKKFLAVNGMGHILRAHQLCQEGFQILYDDRLSTVWSAPNYCYRCGNMASVLEVGLQGQRFFNVFAAAPENDAHKDLQQAGERAADGNALPDYFL
ncbi:Ser/Thr protein phosphatase [Emericellopsis cladophorae]|uniref:protein-serine/threonine phosphatase n=1 Tax=Emericellopsis cladophorae TaxID=2686198 RepID=A0A9P9XW16_9HYPO|nr:Ser/Thr protein phosphatase [Emericellopsis cladophorae]KAI6778485.1 Ser/Thr protein phosphatase [Emericellopsis cladophorae]